MYIEKERQFTDVVLMSLPCLAEVKCDAALSGINCLHKLTWSTSVTYIWDVQSKLNSRDLPVSSQFRHVYYSVAAGNTPHHFRFSVSSDVFKDPSVFGRPVGVFNADCYGYTPQDPSDTRMRVKLSEDSNTKRRFPLATGFKDKAEAAVECDFWKLVLRRKYFLEIPWSHGTYEAFIEAAHFAQRDPLAELEDESRWTHELVDFINEHQAKLLQHRDAHKPELDLDEWEKAAKKLPSRALFVWVQQVRAAQRELEQFEANTRGMEDRLKTLLKYYTSIRDARKPECLAGKFAGRVMGLNTVIQSGIQAHSSISGLLQDMDKEQAQLESALNTLTNSRPPAIPDSDSGTPMHYQSNVS